VAYELKIERLTPFEYFISKLEVSNEDPRSETKLGKYFAWLIFPNIEENKST